MVVIIILFGCLYYLSQKEKLIITPEQKYNVLTADSTQEHTQGLSNMKMLDENTVMLFIFEKPDYYGIWMKDMLFSIDIVYLDENYTVINYFDNVLPESYPDTYYPEKPAKYVIEMASGQRLNSGIAKNTKVYYK